MQIPTRQAWPLPAKPLNPEALLAADANLETTLPFLTPPALFQKVPMDGSIL
jgi:hypothetical protein